MMSYFLFGVCWLWYLEWFSLSYLEEPYNKPWTWPQRIYTLVFWPISLGHWLKGFWDTMNNKD